MFVQEELGVCLLHDVLCLILSSMEHHQLKKKSTTPFGVGICLRFEEVFPSTLFFFAKRRSKS